MKTRTITVLDLVGSNHVDYDQLLVSIEITPDSFTQGRRNNDMVNWFIIKRLIDIDAFDGGDIRSLSRMIDVYCEDWDHMVCGLMDAQQDDLNSWYDNGCIRITPASKIERFVSYYGKMHDPNRLANLWLPMEYPSPGQQPENQLQLTEV